MKILFIGDLVGKAGREIARRAVPLLVERHGLDLVVANVENAAAGFGVTHEIGESLLGCGIDVMTSGNHIWDKKEALEYIERESRLLRPANFPPGAPGAGSCLARASNGESVGVINVMGRVHMAPLDNPFPVVMREIEALRARTPLIIVDFHAEATSEKVAMGWHLAGQATLVVGTHTHVQTADERVLPGGTAYITDVGMTGAHDGVIGMEKEPALARFLTCMPSRLEPATGNPRLNAVLVTADPRTGHATAIERLNLSAEQLAAMADKTVKAT